jgi:hypothetical protein
MLDFDLHTLFNMVLPLFIRSFFFSFLFFSFLFFSFSLISLDSIQHTTTFPYTILHHIPLPPSITPDLFTIALTSWMFISSFAEVLGVTRSSLSEFLEMAMRMTPNIEDDRERAEGDGDDEKGKSGEWSHPRLSEGRSRISEKFKCEI